MIRISQQVCCTRRYTYVLSMSVLSACQFRIYCRTYIQTKWTCSGHIFLRNKLADWSCSWSHCTATVVTVSMLELRPPCNGSWAAVAHTAAWHGVTPPSCTQHRASPLTRHFCSVADRAVKEISRKFLQYSARAFYLLITLTMLNKHLKRVHLGCLSTNNKGNRWQAV